MTKRWQNNDMKLAWAIICSFVLVGTPFLSAPAQSFERDAQVVHACCPSVCKMPCCRSRPVSDSQSLPAVPTQTGGQNQVPMLSPSALALILPDSISLRLSPSTSISFAVKGSPLYERNCARLI
jgi:hypothetical protein